MQRDGHSHLPNMRAIQSNLAMIGRNVSNLSPHASCMMDGIFLWQREARSKASVGLEASVCVFRGGVHQARVGACSHAYQCLLCGYAVRWFLLFVFLLQQSDMSIWKGDAGIIDTEARCGHVIWKLETACVSAQADVFAWDYIRYHQRCSLPVLQSAVQEFSFVVLVYEAYHKLVWVSQSFLCCMVST